MLTRLVFRVGDLRLTGGRPAVDRELAALGPMKQAEWSVVVVFLVMDALWILRPLLERWTGSDEGMSMGVGLVSNGDRCRPREDR